MQNPWQKFVAIILVSVFAQEGRAWGRVGHQLIGEIGAALAIQNSDFWSKNTASIGFLANAPDFAWKSGPGAEKEKPTHWFEPDQYFSSPDQFKFFPQRYSIALAKYGEAELTKNGLAPWRIRQLYDLAVAALKKKNYMLALQMAGSMAHYVGDLSQPLHVTKNYDGQETGDKGIHKFFETDVLEAANLVQLKGEVTRRARLLLQDPAFVAQLPDSIVAGAFNEVNRSFAFKDKVLENDKHFGRGAAGADAQLELARSRLADGAATLALILSRISAAAGAKTGPANLYVKVPKWVPLKFTDEKP